MDKIVTSAISKIAELEAAVPTGRHIVTADIRRLSSSLYRQIDNPNFDKVARICDELLEQHSWALGVVAFEFAYRARELYTDPEHTYKVFYRWLKDYVRGWGDCDDFCTHAFAELLRQNKHMFERVLSWTTDSDFWVRRASAVILIPLIMRNDYDGINPYLVSDALMTDGHDLVQKGYGWTLKALSSVDCEGVKNYLIKNHDVMPRTAFRYACEKFDKDTRRMLMNL